MSEQTIIIPSSNAAIATLVVAVVGFIVTGIGFLLREQRMRRRLAIALLIETREKVDALTSTLAWCEDAEERLRRGVLPHLILDR